MNFRLVLAVSLLMTMVINTAAGEVVDRESGKETTVQAPLADSAPKQAPEKEKAQDAPRKQATEKETAQDASRKQATEKEKAQDASRKQATEKVKVQDAAGDAIRLDSPTASTVKPHSKDQPNRDTTDDTRPQILSPDLVRKQEFKETPQVINFVVIGENTIKTIVINGVFQQFKPATTVVITKRFGFEQGKSTIIVTVVDEKGNKNEKEFLVGYGKRKIEKYLPDKKAEFSWTANLESRLEIDSNPTNDMSSPIHSLQGVVSDDSQSDIRLKLKGVVTAEFGSFNGLFGGIATQYQKGINDFLNSQVVFGGVGIDKYISKGRSLILDYMLVDMNVGGYDYAVAHTLSPGIAFRSRNNRHENRILFLGVDFIAKDFAAGNREDGTRRTYKLDYRILDDEQLHYFRGLVAVGNSTEGTKESEYSFYKFDLAWKNRWEFGLFWDFGFGLQRRTFEDNTPTSMETMLGSEYVDLPFRFSSAVGWDFDKRWKLAFEYEHTINLSNNVPYERKIYGLVLSGKF
ncbi:MAG: hypothetical protein GY866_31220 [Proteobacteria bacterium]|nr:hypothetical protein [Pseudomonadota bacterium]